MRSFLILLALPALGAAAQQDERRFMLTAFERVRVDGPFDVRVTSGLPGGAVVSGDKRAVDRVNLRVDGGTLVVTTGTSNWDGWKEGREGITVVTVSTQRLRAANVVGGGSLTIDRIVGQRVDLGVNGAGTLAVASIDADQLVTTLTGTGAVTVGAGTARNARFMSYGAGSIDAAGLVANDLTVHSQSAGDSRFTARFTATVSTLGKGAVRVGGGATCKLSGPGPATCAGKIERR